MWLYSILLLCSLSVPLMLSFDKKLRFYKQWKYVLPSIFIVAFFYLAFDIYFTRLGIWGFNPEFHLPVLFFKLPVEEWLFFLIVPYASIFLHEVIKIYFPRLRLSPGTGKAMTVLFIALFSVIVLYNLHKVYTVYIFGLSLFALVLSMIDKTRVTDTFYLSFLVIIIPLLLVDGILTGSLDGKVIVWYNNAENLNVRLHTIPVEDFAYAFSLILLNLLLVERFKHNKLKIKGIDK